MRTIGAVLGGAHQLADAGDGAGEGGHLGRHDLPDINDRTGDLLGKTGLAVSSGRVLVDGAEWDAEVEFGEPLQPGGQVEVIRVLGGAKLAVRPV